MGFKNRVIRMELRKNAGLTLIELMVVVAILAIISAIAIPVYTGYVQEARYGTALKDMRQMQLILDDLASENGLVAMDGGDTGVLGVFTNAAGQIVINDTGAVPPGATAWLDPWDNIYRYQRPDNTLQDYTLLTAGPDGVLGNSDDASPH